MTCWLDSSGGIPARGVTYVGQAVGKDDEHLHLAVRGGRHRGPDRGDRRGAYIRLHARAERRLP